MNRLTLAMIVSAAIPVAAIAQTTTTPPADPSVPTTNTTAPVDAPAPNTVDPASSATTPDTATNTTATPDPVTKRKKKPVKPEEPRI